MTCNAFFSTLLDKLDAGKVTRAVKRVLMDPTFTTRSKELSRLLRESSGAKGAADAILSYTKASHSGDTSYQTSRKRPPMNYTVKMEKMGREMEK